MSTAEAISNYDDVIDSRDVIVRIDELRDERESHEAGPEAWAAEYPEEAEELAALEALAEEASGYAADWEYGEALIRDSYFAEYAEQLAEDIGAIQADGPWPVYCIDWDRAARELKMDYTAVEFGGVTYWIR